jgi:hypothetical protein
MPSCQHEAAVHTGTLPQRLKQAADHHLNYRRRAALRMLLAFVITFGLIRLLTLAIHLNLGPFHDITIGGGKGASIHLHHYIWGLLLLGVCGFLALSLEAARWHPFLAIPFGIGLALVLDEFALLLQLQDVYWTSAGVISVTIGLVVAGLLLIYFIGQCYWHAVFAELRRGAGFIRAEEKKLAGHF